MAALSAAQKASLLADTYDMAQALLEDLAHFRNVSTKPDMQPSELRVLSVTLRRLLVNSELGKIATPRIGRIEVPAPDYHPLYELANNAAYVQFIGSGCETKLYGINIGVTTAASLPAPAVHCK
jgi:hypothetical protein